MAVIPTPGRMVTASATLARTVLTGVTAGLRGGPRQDRTSAPARPGDPGLGTNPTRRFSSATSRALAGRGPASRGRTVE